MTEIVRCPNCRSLIEPARDNQKAAFTLMANKLAAHCDWPRGSGQFLSPKKWKQLVLYAWDREHDPESTAQFVPALDGHGFDAIFDMPPAWMCRQHMRDILDYTTVFCAEQGIEIK